MIRIFPRRTCKTCRHRKPFMVGKHELGICLASKVKAAHIDGGGMQHPMVSRNGTCEKWESK